MGLFTDSGRNAMLNGSGFAATATYGGLLTAATAKTGTATASTDLVSSTSHGYSNTDVVVFTVLTGGTGLVLLQPYYVISSLTNSFAVSTTSGGSAVNILTDYSAISVKKLSEVTGGSPAYARKAWTWAAASAGSVNTSADPVFDVPASTVDFVGFFSAVTSGNLLGISQVTSEVYAGQGTYTVTDTPTTIT